MSAARRSAVLMAMAVALAVGATSRAANQMYRGSLVIESFGNDAVGGIEEFEFFSVFAMPQGIQCNPDQPRCNFASTPVVTTPMGAKIFHPLGAVCVPIAYFGATARPAKGATPPGKATTVPLANVHYRNPNFFMGGAPNQTQCTAAATVSAPVLCPYPRTAMDPDCGYATFPLTTNDPLRGKVMKGAPLSGVDVVPLTGTGPAGFKLRAAPPTAFPKLPTYQSVMGLRRTTSGEFNNIPPYVYSYTYATLRNDAGSFFAGGGPGAFELKYQKGGNIRGHITVKAGANKFGGVMRLLGQLTTRVCYYRNGGCSLGGNDWRYEVVGTSAYTVGGIVTMGYVALNTAMYYHTALMQTVTNMVRGYRFSWTTGSVTVTGTDTPHFTIERRKGYDKRTALGKGTIQLVTPVLTRWSQPSFDQVTGGIGIFRLQFVPEPGKWVLLVAGLSMLGILYRARRR
jgi:hypothetical protein